MGTYRKQPMFNYENLPKPSTLLELTITAVLMGGGLIFKGLHLIGDIANAISWTASTACYACGAISAVCSFYPPAKEGVIKIINNIVKSPFK